MVKKVVVKKQVKTNVDAEVPNEPKDNSFVVIDYPQENEVISSSHYAVKIRASQNGAVEVSVDGGNWKPCRLADGFLYYDWFDASSGSHKIAARLNNNGVIIKKSTVRKCVKM